MFFSSDVQNRDISGLESSRQHTPVHFHHFKVFLQVEPKLFLHLKPSLVCHYDLCGPIPCKGPESQQERFKGIGLIHHIRAQNEVKWLSLLILVYEAVKCLAPNVWCCCCELALCSNSNSNRANCTIVREQLGRSVAGVVAHSAVYCL